MTPKILPSWAETWDDNDCYSLTHCDLMMTDDAENN